MTMKPLLAAAAMAALAAGCATSDPPPTQLTEDVAPMQETAQAEVNALNDLASAFVDAQDLYKDASNIPDDNEAMRQALARLSQERGEQLEAIQMRVNAMGGEADTVGDALGVGHKMFTELRTAISDDSEVAVEEVLRGDRYLADKIGETLTGDLSPDTVAMLEGLREDIRADITKLEEMDRSA